MQPTNIKRILSATALLILFHTGAQSQIYTTRTGFIGFYSKTPLEDIRAENNQVFAAIDAGKKNIAFSLLLRGFVFTKELMQEHFNENYVESDKYPKATFSGSFTGDVDLSKDGVYRVMVKGNLNLHNVTHPLESPGTMEVKGGKLTGTAEFKVKPEDYNISIPSLVRDKIAQEMRVNVKIECTTNK
jgi:hypothetical protein